MGMAQLSYKIEEIPDLTLNKYASLDGSGVDGVLDKHLAFLRQWNRKGLLSGISIHLYYFFDGAKEDGSYAAGVRGNKLHILFAVRGEENTLMNVPQLVRASALSDYFAFTPCSLEKFLEECNIAGTTFCVCSTLIKKEVSVKSSLETGIEDGGYYTVPQWEMNEDGRLYNMCKLMESLDKQMLYRIDLFPVERSDAVREALRKPSSVLRERQYAKAGATGQRDYEAENVLRGYDDLLGSIDSSPHFIANLFVFANDRENSAVVLDAAGAEALAKGSYEIGTFAGKFGVNAFLSGDDIKDCYDPRKKLIMQKGAVGWIICKEASRMYRLRYLPNLFTLEEAAPFFRFPALYEGEVIQKRKETAPGEIPAYLLEVESVRDPAKVFSNILPPACPCPKCGARIVTRQGDQYIGIRADNARKRIPHKETSDHIPDFIFCGSCASFVRVIQNGMLLGIDDNGYDVYFPLKLLSKHGLIAGVPGSGKTNEMHHLASTLWKKHRIPFLVLEPAKQEYRALANQPGMEELYIFAPCADMLFPLHINPFEFPKGMVLSEHIRKLEEVFEGAFPMDAPAPFILDNAIEGIYRDKGWTPGRMNDATLPYPTMQELYNKFEEAIEQTDYDSELKGNLKSVLQMRIGSLLRREMGDVFDVSRSTISPERWLEIPAVIELEAMGSGPANFLTLLLCALIREALKVNPYHDKNYARHVIFIEEAHNLIGPETEGVTGAAANPKQAATDFLVKMLAEVRALKEGIIIADQLPTVMAQEVIKNTGLKIGLRMTSADDRALLGSTMAANPQQIEEMTTFSVGRSLISYEGLQRPFHVQTHEWCGPWPDSACGTENCQTTCPYFRNGDCIPDRERRAAAVMSKPDNELAAFMKDRPVYIEICERSVEVDGEKLVREFKALSGCVDEVLQHMDQLARTGLEIGKIEQRITVMVNELLARPDWEEQQETIDKIQATADFVTQLKIERKEKYLLSARFRKAYDIIVECIGFLVRLEQKKRHWHKLGFAEFGQSKYRDGYAPANRREAQAIAMNNMQRSLFVDAYCLFHNIKRYLPQAGNTEKLLDELNSKLGIHYKQKESYKGGT